MSLLLTSNYQKSSLSLNGNLQCFLHFSSTYRYTIICFESVQCLEITDYTGDDNAPTLPLSYWTEPPLSRLNREVKQNLTQGLHSDGNCSHVSDLWLYIVTDTRGSPTGPWVSKFWLQNTFLWRWKLLCFSYIYMHVYNFFYIVNIIQSFWYMYPGGVYVWAIGSIYI